MLKLSYESVLRAYGNPDLESNLKDVGCFQLSGDSVSALLRLLPLRLCRELHELPEEVKARCSVTNSPGNRGFFQVQASSRGGALQQRSYSSFEVGVGETTPLSPLEEIIYAPNTWLSEIQHGAELLRLSDAFRLVANDVASILSIILKENSEFLISLATRPACQLRMLCYPSCSRKYEESPVSLGIHTDYELFTIIVESYPALEAYSEKEGWNLIPMTGSHVTVLIGDMFEVLSNGAYPACLHRVRTPDKDRYSAAFFFGPNSDSIIKPRPRFGTEMYEPVNFGSHLCARTIENYPHLMDRFRRRLIPLSLEVGTGNPYKRKRMVDIRSGRGLEQ